MFPRLRFYYPSAIRLHPNFKVLYWLREVCEYQIYNYLFIYLGYYLYIKVYLKDGKIVHEYLNNALLLLVLIK